MASCHFVLLIETPHFNTSKQPYEIPCDSSHIGADAQWRATGVFLDMRFSLDFSQFLSPRSRT